MSELKKPIQNKMNYGGVEYTVQKLPAMDAFLQREELSTGRLFIYLIDNTIVNPQIKADELEHPNDIRDLGTLLMAYQYGDTDEYKDIEKKLKEGLIYG